LIHIPDELAAVDGKTVRCSRDHANGKPAIHMVNAWAVHHGLVLGQVKTDAKSNEITAIPELLKTMDLNGCVVTIDAMGCQKEIAEDVVGQGADYVFSLKGNQGNLHEEKDNWAKLKSFGMVESERDIDGHVSVETRYYISSLPSDTKRFAVAARGHWAVEKQPPLVSGHCFP
jgi:predicted transposase YbfD/YdcC